jgi:hypothetical protein
MGYSFCEPLAWNDLSRMIQDHSCPNVNRALVRILLDWIELTPMHARIDLNPPRLTAVAGLMRSTGHHHAAEVVKKLKLIVDTARETEIRRLGRFKSDSVHF